MLYIQTFCAFVGSVLLSFLFSEPHFYLYFYFYPRAPLDIFYVDHLHITLLYTRVADSALFIRFSDISNTQQSLKNRLASALLSVNKAIIISRI